ncbi:PucR family transcriptional regulator [Streptomyces sp. O3]
MKTTHTPRPAPGGVLPEEHRRSMNGLPPELAAIMRPELPSLIGEIGAEIRSRIPEYAALCDGPYGRAVESVIRQALGAFVEKVASPAASTARRDETLRRFGRFEAYEGRGLDTMEAAFRLGTRMALRHARTVARRYSLPPGLLLSFADALIAYLDELAAVAREGYLEAKAETRQGRDAQRRRLLRLILAGAAAPRAVLAELSERLKWPLPDEVALLAFAPDGLPLRGGLGDDALLDLSGDQPCALLPGPLDDGRRTALEPAPASVRGAVGLTVPIADAPESLRWARRALSLVNQGVLPPAPLTYCAEHLVTLLLFAEPTLIDALARQQLQSLAALTPSQRDRLLETLRAWLDTQGNTVRMAERLRLHPQTVRYRMRGLDTAFRGLLADSDGRFAVEIALRALHR